MGKASKVKYEFLEVKELVGLIQVLKDVADMKYHSLSAAKDHFQRFGESFAEFFRLVSFSQVRHPLVSNDNAKIAVVAITTEEGFVGDLNSKVVARAVSEGEKHTDVEYVIVGKRGVGKCEQYHVVPVKVFEDYAEKGLYETAIMLKDYLVKGVMSGHLGGAVVVYPWPKDFNTLKPRVLKLLPCQSVLRRQNMMMERFEQVIEESDPVDIVGYLVDVWLTARFYEVLYDTGIATAAAQAAQLDSSLDKMKKESATVKLKYRKARKSDIDNGLREVFSARMMTAK